MADRRTIDGFDIRWNAELAQSYYSAGHWSSVTLADALREALRVDPHRAVVIAPERTLRVAELDQESATLAMWFTERYPSGSVVSFMLPNYWEAVVIYLAITRAGCVAHPILPSLRAAELSFMLDDAHSRCLFIPEKFRGHDYVGMMEQVCQTIPNNSFDVVVLRGTAGTFERYEDIQSRELEGDLERAVDADSVRLLMYTSGTTGRPKGVLHTHNSMAALLQQIGLHWQVDPNDRFLVASPISHIGGSIYTFEMPLLLGTTAVLMSEWEPDAALQAMRDHHITHFAGATPFLSGLLAAAQKSGDRLPDLKIFICGGASVPAQLVDTANDYFASARVTRVYGSTEIPVTTVGVFPPQPQQFAAESDGALGFAQVELREEHGVFEVYARGPQMFVGYLHREDEAGLFDSAGYFRTGDQAHWLQERYLVIDGRSKDIIIRNGENISPKEIEDRLMTHPDIAQAAVIGIPDAKTGERAVAVVVTRDNIEITLPAVADFLASQGVARFKTPEGVYQVDDLPKNDAGKVLKHRLREWLADGAAMTH